MDSSSAFVVFAVQTQVDHIEWDDAGNVRESVPLVYEKEYHLQMGYWDGLSIYVE